MSSLNKLQTRKTEERGYDFVRRNSKNLEQIRLKQFITQQVEQVALNHAKKPANSNKGKEEDDCDPWKQEGSLQGTEGSESSHDKGDPKYSAELNAGNNCDSSGEILTKSSKWHSNPF